MSELQSAEEFLFELVGHYTSEAVECVNVDRKAVAMACAKEMWRVFNKVTGGVGSYGDDYVPMLECLRDGLHEFAECLGRGEVP